MFSLDLKDCVFPNTHPSSLRKYLRLEFRNTVFQFRALPFRISTAPWFFTKVVGVVKELFHRDGSSLFQCLEMPKPERRPVTGSSYWYGSAVI